MLNLTAHSVSIFNETDCHLDSQGRKLIVNTGAEPVLTVPAGEVVNIKFTTTLVGKVGNVPVYETTGTIHNEVYDDDVITSVLAAPYIRVSAGHNVYTVHGTVYPDEQSRPCGCLGLLRYQP